VARLSPAAKRPKQRAGIKPRARSVAGVFGGDSACLRAVVHHWTGRAPSAVLTGEEQVVRLADTDNRRDLVVLCDPSIRLDPWPGGPLVWMYPERGPSDPELAQMRVALNANESAAPSLQVLLCLPHDVELAAASSDLDIISETLRWAVDPGVEMEIEAVWLSGTHDATLAAWLATLK